MGGGLPSIGGVYTGVASSYLFGEVCYLSPEPCVIFSYLVNGLVHCLCSDVGEDCNPLGDCVFYLLSEHALQCSGLCPHSWFNSIVQQVLYGLEQGGMVQFELVFCVIYNDSLEGKACGVSGHRPPSSPTAHPGHKRGLTSRGFRWCVKDLSLWGPGPVCGWAGVVGE